MSITIYKTAPFGSIQRTLTHKTFTFPGGETGVKLDADNLRYQSHDLPHTLVARLTSAADFMELIMVADALRRWNPRPIRLVLPYVPYGRQDRVCVPGEALSLRVFGDLINALDFTEVITFDPHSEVTAAVLNNLTVVDQTTIVSRFEALNKRLQPATGPRPLLVSPDAGANKKTAALAAHFGMIDFIRADKKRDLATGKLSGFKVYTAYEEQLQGAEVVIVDDLADGAGTFIGLADELKHHGAASVVLYVTHGLFTKGFDHLWAGGIDAIYTTNAYRTNLPVDSRLTVLDIEIPNLFPI